MGMKLSTKSGTFLVEMIVVILFFSISAALTLQLFVGAHTRSKQSAQQSGAAICVQTAAECVKKESSTQRLDQILDGCEKISATADSTVYGVYYDKGFQPVKKADAVYHMKIVIKEEKTPAGSMVDGDIGFYEQSERDENAIYSLQVEKYRPQ